MKIGFVECEKHCGGGIQIGSFGFIIELAPEKWWHYVLPYKHQSFKKKMNGGESD